MNVSLLKTEHSLPVLHTLSIARERSQAETEHLRLYWGAQLLGWGGMVFVETVNYTFYIIGEFRLSYFLYFMYNALVGAIGTHLYRRYLLKKELFQNQGTALWVSAVIQTFILSSLLMLSSLLPGVVANFNKFIDTFHPLDIFASTMNWMRYAGVWVIIYYLYQVLEQRRKASEDRMQAMHLVKSTELELLRSKLNPHFLFNALNSIKAMVSIDPEKSREAIVQLSELLRYTLNYGSETTVELYREWDELNKYLKLEQLRYGDRLEIDMKMETELEEHPIPPATLLTLAENAFKHGISKHSGKAKIEIFVKPCPEGICIEINNPGKLEESHYKREGGLGIKIIKERLDRIYGQRAKFEMLEKDGRVHVKLTIPS
jgi:sensor histidine kinase YesM